MPIVPDAVFRADRLQGDCQLERPSIRPPHDGRLPLRLERLKALALQSLAKRIDGKMVDWRGHTMGENL